MSMHSYGPDHIGEVANTLRRARAEAGLSLRELARRAGTSHPTLSAYEQGRKMPSVETFVRILRACGYAVDFELSPRIRQSEGLERGAELEAALELAAEFPARHAAKLTYPRFAVS
jgi:transcriptional regulator with XRE-family HTH domain